MVAAVADEARDPRAAMIVLDDVSLFYRLARQRAPSFKEYAIHWIRGALVHESFWALREISFTVRRGETVRYVASVQHAIANNGKTAAKAILVVEYSPGT